MNNTLPTNINTESLFLTENFMEFQARNENMPFSVQLARFASEAGVTVAELKSLLANVTAVLTARA